MKITITIDPGSEFQEKVMKESIKVLLTGFKTHYQQTHKKNKIKIEYDNDDLCDQES